MNIGIVSYCSKQYKPLARITVEENKWEYCARHDYTLNVRYVPETCSRTAGYERMNYVMELLTGEVDFLWVQGVDTMIMNFQTKIESFLEAGAHFIISRDINILNADSYIIRNSLSGKMILRSLIGNRANYENHVWADSEAINCYHKEMPNRIKVLPQKSFNSYDYNLYNRSFPEGQYSEGDFLIHWPGLGLEKRLELANEYKGKVIK